MNYSAFNEMTNIELSDVNGGAFWTGIAILGTVVMGAGLVIAFAPVAPLLAAAIVLGGAIALPAGIIEVVGGNI